MGLERIRIKLENGLEEKREIKILEDIMNKALNYEKEMNEWAKERKRKKVNKQSQRNEVNDIKL